LSGEGIHAIPARLAALACRSIEDAFGWPTRVPLPVEEVYNVSIQRPKLADVARFAGVSPATVSRVLNHPEIVTPDLRAKVLGVVRQLGYAPDATARALSLGRSGTIGAVVPTLGIAIFADGITALQGRLRELGRTLLVANSEYDAEKELQEVRVFLERGVDGLVLVGDLTSLKAGELARQYGTPIITTYVGTSRSLIPAVGIDNADAMSQMVTYLLGLGHTAFGVITDATRRNDRVQARRHGIMRALRGAGISLKMEQIVEVSYSVGSGRAGLRQLIHRCPETTAVICTSDALAIGALVECRAMGLLVPQDLSITGYDDIEIAQHSDPPLTTVTVPAHEIGRIAADHLVTAIAGKAPPASTILPTQLTIRGSCAAPRDSLRRRRLG
jgi:LacI family transcriptional regulator